MVFTCKRCGYQCDHKSVLLRHLEKKKICIPMIEDVSIEDCIASIQDPEPKPIKCKFCSCQFNHRSNQYRHEKNCKNKPSNYVHLMSPQELRKHVNQLTDELNHMQSQYNILTNTPTNYLNSTINTNNTNNITNNNVTNNTNNTNNTLQNVGNNNNITIVMNNFGNETYDHIDEEFIKHCILNSITGMRNLIEKIHFSNDAPKNKNIRLKSLKRNMVEVSNDQKWTVKDANEAMETMIKKGCRLMNGVYMNPESGLQELDEKEFEYQLHIELNKILAKDQNLYYDLRRRILALLVSHSQAQPESQPQPLTS